MSNSHDLSSLFFLRSSCTYSSSSSSYPLHPSLIPLPSSSYRTRVFVYASSSSDVRKRFLRVHYKTTTSDAPVIFFIHGGFWKNKYHIDNNCHDTLKRFYVDRGFVFVDVEYRARDDVGGGYPGTCDDVYDAYRYFISSCFFSLSCSIDLDRIVIMGHSAGGQLALRLSTLVKCSLVVCIAPCCNLVEGVKCELGDDGTAVLRFMGCHYSDCIEAYEDAGSGLYSSLSPQFIVSGGLDVDIPSDYVYDHYVSKRKKEFGITEYLHVSNADHYDLTNASHESTSMILSVILKYIK